MSFFTKQRTTMESLKIVVDISDYISKTAEPLTLQICNLVRDQRFLDVIDFQIDYTWKFSTNDFIYARQVQALFNKQDFIDLGIDKEEVAFHRFLKSELMCRETNKRLELNDSQDWDVNAVLYYAIEKISKVLGQAPSLDSLDFSFGPGASTSTKSTVASPRAKLSGSLECSTEFVSRLVPFLEQVPMLCGAHSLFLENEESWLVPVNIVPGKLTFVPKTAKTHRSIVVEPVLSGLYQKGIGSFLKDRLKLAGIDLRDQTRNQTLAREGSVAGNLATIDLSMASDCVSRSLVWTLLPYEWADLLEAGRTGRVSYKYKKHEYLFELEKFSSMGNAYTFELESLIFYALTWAACKHLKVDGDISIYGDDIICPVESYELLERVLQYCGFSFNRDKSFAEGPFRESCGADYYQGIDIRPFYVNSRITEQSLYVMHNWFIRHGEIKTADYILQKYINKEFALKGPDGYGDGHLIGEWNPRVSRKMKRAGFDGGVFDTYRLNPRTIRGKLRKGDYVFPCYSSYVNESDRPTEALNCVKSGDPTNPGNIFTIRGTRGVSKISIYTLARSIFWTDNGLVTH